MINIKAIIFATAIISCSTFFQSSSSVADDQGVALTREQLINLYESFAFTSINQQLDKPDTTKPSFINIHCLAPSCDFVAPVLSKYLRAPWLQPRYVKDFDPSELISLWVAEGSNQFDKNLSYNKLQGEKVLFDGNPGCSSFVIVADRFRARQITIAAKADLPEKQFVSCILIQLERMSGLHEKNSFKELWGENGELNQAPDAVFERIMKGGGAILALHFLPMTKPGMNKEEFESAVKQLSISNLIGEKK